MKNAKWHVRENRSVSAPWRGQKLSGVEPNQGYLEIYGLLLFKTIS
jgi:hypothetical protein